MGSGKGRKRRLENCLPTSVRALGSTVPQTDQTSPPCLPTASHLKFIWYEVKHHDFKKIKSSIQFGFGSIWSALLMRGKKKKSIPKLITSIILLVLMSGLLSFIWKKVLGANLRQSFFQVKLGYDLWNATFDNVSSIFLVDTTGVYNRYIFCPNLVWQTSEIQQYYKSASVE